jgi:hypothetical protein
MKLAILATSPLLFMGCMATDDLVAMDRDMAQARSAGDRAAAAQALCSFVGLDASCVGDDGPVPPPPPEASDAGYLWAVFMPLPCDGTEQRYRVTGSFETEDGSKAGDITGILIDADEHERWRLLADTEATDPSWGGMLSGKLTEDEVDPGMGVISGGWARALYTEIARYEGTWQGAEDRPGGRIIGSFDFDPVTEEPVEGPIEEI